MSVALLVMTDGRKHIVDAVRSLDTMLRGPVTRRLIHDDSGDTRHRAWLRRTFPDWEILGEGDRLGFAGAYARAWNYLAHQVDEPLVFSTEDDFLLGREVFLPLMGRVLAKRPMLLQLALRRQAWNQTERAAGGIVEMDPASYVDCFDGISDWLEHRNWWTTNPSLHPRDVCEVGWPVVGESEGHLSRVLAAEPDVRFGYWGARDSGEWVEHIGRQRVGTGY